MKYNLNHKQPGFVGFADSHRKERLLEIISLIGCNEERTVKLKWPTYHDQEQLNRGLTDPSDIGLGGPNTILTMPQQLAAYSDFIRMGVPVIPAPSFQDVDIPVVDRSRVAGFGADTPDNDTEIIVGLGSPRRVSDQTKVSTRMKIQNEVLTADYVERQLLSSVGEAIDKAILTADGTGKQPTGILSDPDVLSLVRTGGEYPTLTDMAAAERLIADSHGEANADDYFWAADTATREILSTQPAEVPGGTFGETLWNRNNSPSGGVFGYPATANVHAPAETLVLCQREALAIIDWGMMEVSTIPDVDQAVAGFTCLQIEAWMDVLVVDPNGVCKLLPPA